MIIAVIAANGRAGQAFVRMALSRGHQIRAGVFGVHSLQAQPGLEIIPCDATNAEDLAVLLAGSEAVVSLIGHTRRSPTDVQTRAIEMLLCAMQDLGLRRVVSLTGTGVRFPGDTVTLVDRALNLAIKIIDPKRVADGIRHARALSRSDMDWTIIRVLKLTNGGQQSYELLAHGPTRLLTSRTTVAAAICSVLEENAFVAQSPIVARHK